MESNTLKLDQICLLCLLLQAIFCFPPTSWLQQSVSFDDTTFSILPSETGVYQGNVVLFTPIISGDNRTLEIFNYNITGGSTSPASIANLSITFNFSITDSEISLLS